MLPLLALGVENRKSRLSDTHTFEVQIVFRYDPGATRTVGQILFEGPSVIMVVIGYNSLSPDKKRATKQLVKWLTHGIRDATVNEKIIDGHEVNCEWSVKWEVFYHRLHELYSRWWTPDRSREHHNSVPYKIALSRPSLSNTTNEINTVVLYFVIN